MGVFERVQFLHLFCAITYVYLSVYIVVKRPRAWLNRTCALLIISFAPWSGSLLVAHDAAATKQAEAALALEAEDVEVGGAIDGVLHVELVE